MNTFHPGFPDGEAAVQGLLRAEVTDTQNNEKNKKMVMYKVVVHNHDKSSVIYRRYVEFYHLYEKLKKMHPDAHIKFPAKKLFSNNESRREGLNEFINKVCSNPNIYVNPLVVEFLDLKNLTLRSKLYEEDLLNENSEHSEQDEDPNTVNLGPSEKLHARPGDFDYLKIIGKGSFGQVLLAKHKAEGNIYAVKVLKKSHVIKKNEAKHIMSERNVLVKNIVHPFLVGMHYSFQTSDKLYFVLDYVNGGELFYHLQKERSFPEVRARFYAAEMCSAISYLHSLNIIYRDLKPENILLDSEGHVVLTDFGLCKEGIEGRGTTSTFCGTPEYLAPEVLRKMPYDKTVDWWCLGGVLFEMLFGLPPFYSRDTSEMYQNILYKELTFRMNVASLAARNFLEGLLHKDRSKRLGAKQDWVEVKGHPFFATMNWKLLDERKITPPYNPNVDGDMDLKHFDPEFVQEPVPASVGRSFHDRGAVDKLSSGANVFEGFSYVQPDDKFGDYT